MNPSKQAAESRQWIQKLAHSLPIAAAGGERSFRRQSAEDRRRPASASMTWTFSSWTSQPAGSTWDPKAQIYRLIDELACRGKAILMVSSYLPELLGVCDRIAVMCKGRLVRSVPVEQTNEHQIMLEATGALETA